MPTTSYESLQNEIHIHVLSIESITAEQMAHYRTLLSDDELRRISLLKTEALEHESIVSHGALREVLGDYLQADSKSIQFVRGPFGKPRVSHPETPHIEYNLSHSHGLVVIAVSREGALGVDVEWIDPEMITEDLIETVFTPEEQRELRSLSTELFVEGFFTAWTRKEAYIKATGEGFSAELQSFSVTVDPRKPAKLKVPNKPDCYIQSLDLNSGFAAALAVEGESANIKIIGPKV